MLAEEVSVTVWTDLRKSIAEGLNLIIGTPVPAGIAFRIGEACHVPGFAWWLSAGTAVKHVRWGPGCGVGCGGWTALRSKSKPTASSRRAGWQYPLFTTRKQSGLAETSDMRWLTWTAASPVVIAHSEACTSMVWSPQDAFCFATLSFSLPDIGA